MAAVGDGFILLAPEPANGGMEGLLIAQGRVSGQTIQVKLDRQTLRVRVPEFTETVIACSMFVAVG